MGRPDLGLRGAVRRRAGGKSARRAAISGFWCPAVRWGWVRAAGAGGGWATFLWLLPCLVARPGTSAAALGPGPALVSVLSSVPAFLGWRGR